MHIDSFCYFAICCLLEMFEKMAGTRRRGRLATRWLETLTKALGITLEDLARLAQN